MCRWRRGYIAAQKLLLASCGHWISPHMTPLSQCSYAFIFLLVFSVQSTQEWAADQESWETDGM